MTEGKLLAEPVAFLLHRERLRVFSQKSNQKLQVEVTKEAAQDEEKLLAIATKFAITLYQLTFTL